MRVLRWYDVIPVVVVGLIQSLGPGFRSTRIGHDREIVPDAKIIETYPIQVSPTWYYEFIRK